jgi:hypothetical protein
MFCTIAEPEAGLQVDTGVHVVSSTAQYSRKQASNIVGEERLKPVDNFVSQAQTAVHDGVDCLKHKGIFGASKVAINKTWSGAQSLGSYVKSTVLEVNHTVSDGAIAVRKKLDTAQGTLYKEWLVPAGASLLCFFFSCHVTSALVRLHTAAHVSCMRSLSPRLAFSTTCSSTTPPRRLNTRAPRCSRQNRRRADLHAQDDHQAARVRYVLRLHDEGH